MSQVQNVTFDTPLYLINNQSEYIFTRGFIDTNLHLSKKRYAESEFKFEQKNYNKIIDKCAIKQPLVFGTEILIKHTYSNFYVSVQCGEDSNEMIKLKSVSDEQCYFQILPQRTFEHKGDFVNFQSFFVIRHVKYKCYLGSNIFERGPFRSMIEKQVKTSKIMHSFKVNYNDSKQSINEHKSEDENNSLSFEQEQSMMLSQWEMKSNLIQEIKCREEKLKQKDAINNELPVNQVGDKITLPLCSTELDRSELKECIMEKHIHTMWQAQPIQCHNHPFLQNNDYVYFISSNKHRGIMNILMKRRFTNKAHNNQYTLDIEFVKNLGENQYLCSAIFVVELAEKQEFYLKHLLTGKYFPFTDENVKKRLTLKPLLPLNSTENKLPPFHLLYQNSFYPRSILDDEATCGFWLNKVDPLEINEVLSLEGFSHQDWVPYLLRYLDNNCRKRQVMLQQFKFIRFVIEEMIVSDQDNHEIFKLLFKMMSGNAMARKEVTEYLNTNILQSGKQFIIDILSQIFDNEDNYAEKFITPDQLGYVINRFIMEDQYSVIFLRIFRLFCGHYTQPCQRNQNLIFKFFFNESHITQRIMTQSILSLQKRIEMPNKFKFCLEVKGGIILFNCCEASMKFMELPLKQQEYLRQYLYLLGDCIKLNKQNRQQFIKILGSTYSLEHLLMILNQPSLERLKGPILNLINAAYLQPEYRFKLYVFIKGYDNMCYNGGLVAQHKNGALLDYIIHQISQLTEVCDQIDQIKSAIEMAGRDKSDQLEKSLQERYQLVMAEYKETRFRHFLVMVKYSIQNAYWRSQEAVLGLIDTLGRFYGNKRQLQATTHSSYAEISDWKNYMESTILSIDLAILFLDLKINLVLSHLITLKQQNSERKVQSEIDNFVAKIYKDKQIRHHFNQFQLGNSQNSLLIKKSLILSRKYYELSSIMHEKYAEAIKELKCATEIDNIQEIKSSFHNLKLTNQDAIDTSQLYISKCLPGVKLQDLSASELIKQGFTLNAICRYIQPSLEFQVLAYRLGVLQLLGEDLYRYVNLRVKQKLHQNSSIYWKMILVYVLVKQNRQLKREVSGWRGWLMALIKEDEQKDGQVGLIAIDILQEIYRNWRSLIVSDSSQLVELCEDIVRLVAKDNSTFLGNNSQLNTRLNKMLNLLNVFLTVGERKIRNNFQLVINELFDKETIIKFIIKLRNIDNFQSLRGSAVNEEQVTTQTLNSTLFKVILHQLSQILEQKPQKIGFMLPQTSHLLNLIMAIGRTNWSLIFKIYNVLESKHLCGEGFTLLKIFRMHLNTAVELVYQYLGRQKDETFERSLQIKVILTHFPLLIKILLIILQCPIMAKKTESNPRSSIQLENLPVTEKLQLVERVAILSSFVPTNLALQLHQRIKDFQDSLELSNQQFAKLRLIKISHFALDQLKSNHVSLLTLCQNKELRQEESKGIEKIGKKQLAEPRHSHNTAVFSIEEAKEFIKSLVYINRSDPSILDSELKTFFISFLVSTFPQTEQDTECYNEKLKNHQLALLQYNTAQLITIILQEKYRQSCTLFINLFQLGNKLLENGNSASQKVFLSIFESDHKNVIFENINSIIESSLMGIRFYYNKNVTFAFEAAEDALERQQVSQILKRIFRFLQLLCENDNQDMKKYVYSQTNEEGIVKYMTINFIEIAVNLMSEFIKIVHQQLEGRILTGMEIQSNLLDVVLFIQDFLIEVCQYPAIKNQVYLCNSDFFSIVKTISLYKKEEVDKKMIIAIERRIILLLRGLIEEQNESITRAISKKIEDSDFKALILSSLRAINVSKSVQLEEYLAIKEDSLTDELENVVDILIVCKVLGRTIEQSFTDDYKEVLIEIKKKIREIEVDFKGQITKIYFCYRPIFDHLSESTKQFFINRSSILQSRNEKLRELINSRNVINQDIINRKSRELIASENALSVMFHFSMFLCLVSVGLQLFFYTVNGNGIALDFYEHSIVHGLAVMQFLITFIYFVLWGANMSTIARQKIKFKERQKKQDSKSRGKIKEYQTLFKQIYIEESSSLHASLFLLLSFFSCWFEIRLYSLVLLYMFAKIELLSSILTAIRLTGGKLLLVCLLAFAFSSVFGLLSLNNYINVLFENESIDVDIGHISSHCNSILTCIDSLFTQKIIGETPSREGDSSHYGRFFSDVVYWVFSDILLPNIIAAIIIDKFAELRNIKEKVENEQKNRCFICFVEKSALERKDEEDFEEHIGKKHCIWDYFYYLYYLEKLKSITEYTGIQYWISKQVKENKIDWFPIDESLKDDYDERKISQLFEVFRKKLEEKKPAQ